MSQRVVFTALFGGYEELNDEQAKQNGIDFVCFTDDPDLTSTRWQIVLVDPAFPLDPHRSQRRIKICGHEALAEFDETLYIDNRVSIRGDAAALFDSWLDGADIALSKHSFHATVADEFAAVWIANIDDHGRVAEQWDHYAASLPQVLDADAVWGGIVARRASPEVAKLCQTWFEHVLRYSRRDQLSFRAALATNPASCHLMTMDNLSSEWHEWPRDVRRRNHMRDALSAIRTPPGLAAVLERTATDAEHHRQVAELELKLAQQAQATELALTALAETRSSSSWRITAPLRALRRR